MNWFDYVIIGIVVVAALVGMRIGLIGAAFTVVGALVGWLLAGQYSDDVGALFGDSLSNDTIVTVLSFAIIVVGAVVVSQFAAKIIKPLLTVFTLGMSKMLDRLGGVALGLLVGLAIASVVILASARLTYDFDFTKTGAGQFAQLAEITSALRTALSGTELAEQLAKIDEVRNSLEEPLSESQVPGLLNNLDEVTSALNKTEAGAQLAAELSGRVLDVKAAVGDRAATAKEALEGGMKESKIVSAFISVTEAMPADALGFVPADFKDALSILEKVSQ